MVSPRSTMCISMMLLAAVAAARSVPAQGGKGVNEKCVECHRRFVEKESLVSYSHEPFLKRQCSRCHTEIGTGSADARGVGGLHPEPAQPRDSCRLRILRSAGRTTVHWVWAKGLSKGSLHRFRVVACETRTGGKVRSNWKEFSVTRITQVHDDGRPPEIRDVRVAGMVPAAVPGVSIRWVTDEPADSCVEYGTGKSYGSFSRLQRELTQEHEVTLFGLDRSGTYHYRVISRDVFGNTARSADRVLSLRGLPLQAEPVLPEGAAGSRDVEIQSISLERVGNSDVLVSWRTNVRTFGWLEWEEVSMWTDRLRDEKDELAEKGTPGAKHPPMLDPLKAGIDACYQCHPQSHLGLSHPVGIPSRGKTRMPADLPTANGLITCVTCHLPHGGDAPYLARKKVIGRLCVACHYTKEDVLREVSGPETRRPVVPSSRGSPVNAQRKTL